MLDDRPKVHRVSNTCDMATQLPSLLLTVISPTTNMWNRDDRLLVTKMFFCNLLVIVVAVSVMEQLLHWCLC